MDKRIKNVATLRERERERESSNLKNEEKVKELISKVVGVGPCTTRNNTAITLISLVITIVLLILAGVTLNIIIGENGIFNKAKEAKIKWESAQSDEEMQLSQINTEMENHVNGDRSTTYCTTPATSLTTSAASLANPNVIVESYRNGASWCRVWSDGWIEQGGHATSGATSSGAQIDLIKCFSDTNYTLNCMIAGTYSTSSCKQVFCNSKSVNKFYTLGVFADANSAGGATYEFDWYACGYVY